MKSTRNGMCTYCGIEGPITSDHIPPRNLFPERTPYELITVPSCLKCNQSSSQDDEYFRAILSLWEELSSSPVMAELRPKALRGLQRSEAARFRRSIELTSQRVQLFDPLGRVVRDSTTVGMNKARVNNVVSRITAGLLYRRFGYRLDDTMSLGSQLESELPLTETLRGMNAILGMQEPYCKFPEIYEVRVIWDRHSDVKASMWLHTFYEKINFISAAMPRSWAEDATHASFVGSE
ncbi:MAG: HNH endonuclease [Candidatus Polarisedimenticolia bacterium]